MSPVRWLRHLWQRLARGRRADRDLDDEIRAHVDLLVDEKVRAGVGPDEARRQALVELEGASQVVETVREGRTGAGLEAFLRDVRFGARLMRRRPLPTASAVLALALGIGATTSVFSVVNAVLLRPLPYGEPDRLVVVLHDGIAPVSPANYLDWKARMRSFAGMEAAEFWRTDVVGEGGAEKLYALRVTPGMFPMLGVAPALGRYLSHQDGSDGVEGPAEVVLSHRLWQRRFSGDPAVVGRPVALDGRAYTIVGVMPASFVFAPFWAARAELWAPLSFGTRIQNRGDQSLRVFARLAPGIGVPSAQADVDIVTAGLEAQFPGSNRGVTVVALSDRVVGDVRRGLWLLLGAVGFVLLMTCANVAHMLLAHGTTRFREFGMRLALGASRDRLMRQVLTESLLLVFVGGASGLALAVWGVEALRALGPPDIPRLDTVRIDATVAVFAAGASVITGLLFGLVPAVRASRSGLSATVRPDAGSSRGRGARGLLVVAEFSLAIVLLAGAGLMLRSFLAVQRIEPGFEPAHVLSMTVSVTGAAAGQPGRRAAFFQDVVAAVEALPGVAAASAINHLPLAGDLWGRSFRIDGRPAPRPGEAPSATYRVVMPGYFRAMGIRLLQGRDFTVGDTMTAARVAIVNEYFARRHWPNESALGQRFALRGGSGEPEWMTIVGIAADTLREEWLEDRQEEMYLPFLQSAGYLASPASHYAYLTLVIRAEDDPEALVSAVRDAIWRIEAGRPISDVQTMAGVVAAATARPRFYMMLLSVFAMAALVLAAIGIYGVMSMSVAERRREIGVRLALGAHPWQVRRDIVIHGLRLAFSGTAIGLVGAWLLSGAMRALVYGIEPTDPATLAAVAGGLSSVALAACYLPARRATRADAMSALRED